MSKKTIFALILIGLGVLTGLLVIFTYTMTGGRAAISLSLLIAAVAFIVVVTILAFSKSLDRYVNPIIEVIDEDIQDDIRDIKERRFTNTHLMVVMVGIAALVFANFVVRFHKLEATWGGSPVALFAMVAVVALEMFIVRTKWIQDKRSYKEMWIFLIPTAGLILSMLLGLAKTEDMRAFRAGNLASIQNNTYQATGFILNTSGGLDLSLPDCDGEVCGVIYLVISLIVLTLLLVAGSATIPHFWLLSGSILFGVMALIAIHDLRVQPKRRGASHQWRHHGGPHSTLEPTGEE